MVNIHVDDDEEKEDVLVIFISTVLMLLAIFFTITVVKHFIRLIVKIYTVVKQWYAALEQLKSATVLRCCSTGESFWCWVCRKTPEGRLVDSAKKLRQQAEFLISRKKFVNALAKLDEAVDIMKCNELNKTQSLRNFWADLHCLNASCYINLSLYIESMSEIDQAMLVAQFPNVQMIAKFDMHFRNFQHWCLINFGAFEMEIREYVHIKRNSLKKILKKNPATPGQLLGMCHCYVLTDSLVNAGLDEFQVYLLYMKKECERLHHILDPHTAYCTDSSAVANTGDNLHDVKNTVDSVQTTRHGFPTKTDAAHVSSNIQCKSSNGQQLSQTASINRSTAATLSLVHLPLASYSDRRRDSEASYNSAQSSTAADCGIKVLSASKRARMKKSQRKAATAASTKGTKSTSVEDNVSEQECQDDGSGEVSARLRKIRGARLHVAAAQNVENSVIVQNSENMNVERNAAVGRSRSASESTHSTVTENGYQVSISGEEFSSRIRVCSRQTTVRKRYPKQSSVKLYLDLIGLYDVHLVCDMCVKLDKESGLCENVSTLQHDCAKNRLILFERPACTNGYLVRNRPPTYDPLRTNRLCEHRAMNEPCLERQLCPYPHTQGECDLWLRDSQKEISIADLIADLRISSLRVRVIVESLCSKFRGNFQMICHACYQNDYISPKHHHVPSCRGDAGHDWIGNKMLVFKPDAGIITVVDGSVACENAELQELVNMVQALLTDVSADEIYDEAERLHQKLTAKSSQNTATVPETGNGEDQDDAEYDSDSDVHLAKTDEKIFDTEADVYNVLDKKAFDGDAGDSLYPSTKELEQEAGRSLYYQMLSGDSVQLILNGKRDGFVSGVIELRGCFDAVCRVSGGALDGQEVELRGRVNCGPAFNGDEVLVEIKPNKRTKLQPVTVDNDENQTQMDGQKQQVADTVCRGTVVSILKRNVNRTARTFVCSVGKYDGSLMTPLCGTVPKFHVVDTYVKKRYGIKKNNFVPVYNNELRLQKIIKLDPCTRKRLLFIVKYLKWTNDHRYPLGYVCRIIHQGDSMDSSQMMLNVLYEVPINEIILSEDFKLDDEQPFTDCNRTNLCDLLTISIDPPGSRDIDDALSVTEVSGKFLVWVHIADVTHYVQKGDDIDRQIFSRSLSFYPANANNAFHMLPCKLAEDTCSLLVGKDRLALSVHFTMNENGEILSEPEVLSTVVKNNRQMTYPDVQEVIDEHHNPGVLAVKTDTVGPEIEDMIMKLHHLAEKLRHRRMQDGQHFYQYERQDCFTHEGIEDPFSVDQHHDAHRLIEEFMVLTNITIGRILALKFPDCMPVRRQEGPSNSMLNNWKRMHGHVVPYSFYFKQFEILNHLVERNDGGSSIQLLRNTWVALQNAVLAGDARKAKTIIGSEELHPLHSLALFAWYRIQEPANYSCSCSGDRSHFSLQVNNYVQFTSPIRRYADIIIHRLVKTDSDSPSPYTHSDIIELCRRMNARTRMQTSYSIACGLLRRADILQKPFYVPCYIDDLDDFSIHLNSPYFHKLAKSVSRLKYSELSVRENPRMSSDEDTNSAVLKWEKRFYDLKSLNAMNAPPPADQEFHLDSGMFGQQIEGHSWSQLQNVIRGNNDLHQLCPDLGVILQQNIVPPQLYLHGQHIVREVTSEMYNRGNFFARHHVKFSLCIHHGMVTSVQFGAEVTNGFIQPAIKLLNLTPEKDICIEHRRDPVKAFAVVASERARNVYDNAEQYQRIWSAILAMESATNAVIGDEPVLCGNVPIRFFKRNRVVYGRIKLDVDFCKIRHISIYRMSDEATHDYMCIRYFLRKRFPRSMVRNVWVGHGLVVSSTKKKKKRQIELVVKICYSNSPPSDELFDGAGRQTDCTVEFLQRTLPDKRMAEAVDNLLSSSTSELCRRIALSNSAASVNVIELPILVRNENNLGYHLTVKNDRGEKKQLWNNESQIEAIRTAMTQSVTFIQGPPGTGKTLIGVKIAYWFVELNKAINSEQNQQVLFCGPSNSSVDVASKQLMTRLGSKCPKIVRVYGEMQENMDFPIPRDLLVSNRKKKSEDTALPVISLHYLIRETNRRYSQKILEYDTLFRANRNSPEKVTDECIEAYQKLITKASVEELKRYDIVLCTCSASMGKRIKCGTNITQVIIDECGMCMEPETLVPLVNFPTARQVVLIGDHKQLQPIIMNQDAKTLGLQKSLFERYAESAVMLREQYRMNEKICEFPSAYFYDGLLKTAKNSRWFQREDHFLNIWPNKQYPMVFCHVEGTEKAQAVSTSEGNEQSKKNEEERYHVRRIVKELVNTLGCFYGERSVKKAVGVLSQYKAQCSSIEADLRDEGLAECNVSTVVASQGNEWDYVVLSTVRSLSEYEIDPQPSKGWCLSKMGFICDPHQINVALTRARMGLIIIGNKNLLRCDPMWNYLLEHYDKHSCLVEAADFLQTSVQPGYAERDIPRLLRLRQQQQQQQSNQ